MPLFYQKTVTYLPSLSVTYLTTLYILALPKPINNIPRGRFVQMLRNGQDRSLRMWKSSGRILSEYSKRVLRRADGEHRPLQMEHASWYMAIVCSSALYELLGGEIYLAVSRCTFVHFILHIHLISHFCVPRLKFLEPKWSQIYS